MLLPWLLLVAAAPALASDVAHPWFVGGSVGRAELDADFGETDDSGVLVQVGGNDDTTGWRVFGGYRFNRYLGIEGAYVDFDQYSVSVDVSGGDIRINPELDGVTLALRGTIPIDERFAIMGRAGFFFWDADAAVRVSFGGDRREDDDGSDPFVGAGLEFAVTERFVLRGFYEYYQIDDEDLDYLGLDAEFRF